MEALLGDSGTLTGYSNANMEAIHDYRTLGIIQAIKWNLSPNGYEGSLLFLGSNDDPIPAPSSFLIDITLENQAGDRERMWFQDVELETEVIEWGIMYNFHARKRTKFDIYRGA